ncbi:ribonuclease III [Helicobacter cappadocius]|uniref:Ribonuclease 3 n=1 Tax=Helicobacter cappadocius TaxID=3063998 RepID=A0AA90SRV5_9HELI|nr:MULTISPECIES: ribonuclease III [unclassified Helicobacter]MDO7252367.1 ribonuclease III [Helicobacter sp. faydin-H75]MDP2538234.1 ribonuclease III [Helicobacter sp. faydin-H76]
MTDFKSLEKDIDYYFNDKQLLLQALTHKSHKIGPDNERLEFLGDAVLDLVVGELLFYEFPQSTEGNLSKMRAGVVSEKGFMKLAQSINLGHYLYISQSEEQNQGRNKPSILSNAFEALMGAVYLESGLEDVRRIVKILLEKVYPNRDFQSLSLDYKTSVQELSQAQFFEIPTYELVSESGPDHCKEFEMILLIRGKQYARARGKSKKDAQQKCAQIAYEKLKKD